MRVSVEHLPIKLGAFLKLAGVAATGGHGRLLLEAGDVRVNGVVETRRGRKLRHGDRITVDGYGSLVVEAAPGSGE